MKSGKHLITAHGHPNIKGTHHKTLEFTTDSEISAKATCVLGVEAKFDLSTLKSFSGKLSVEVKCGGKSFVVNGTVNPDFSSNKKIVFRRSNVCDEFTWMFNTDVQAKDISPSLDTIITELDTNIYVDVASEYNGASCVEGLQRQSAPYNSPVLYLVGVPMGADDEFSTRSANILESVDVVAAEDTRKALRLFREVGISVKKLITHHAHNESASVSGLVKLMKEGCSVAYISDAGMPGISDPGFVLAREAILNDYPVVPVNAGTAVIGALVASGISCDRFTFQAFLPRSSGARRARLGSLKDFPDTLVFYEAPHRVLDMLDDVIDTLGDRKACLARELTKVHEEFLRGDLSSIKAELVRREAILGALTLVVEGVGDHGNGGVEGEALDSEIKKMLEEGLKVKQIRDDLSKKFGMNKSTVYERVLQLTGKK